MQQVNWGFAKESKLQIISYCRKTKPGRRLFLCMQTMCQNIVVFGCTWTGESHCPLLTLSRTKPCTHASLPTKTIIALLKLVINSEAVTIPYNAPGVSFWISQKKALALHEDKTITESLWEWLLSQECGPTTILGLLYSFRIDSINQKKPMHSYGLILVTLEIA